MAFLVSSTFSWKLPSFPTAFPLRLQKSLFSERSSPRSQVTESSFHILRCISAFALIIYFSFVLGMVSDNAKIYLYMRLGFSCCIFVATSLLVRNMIGLPLSKSSNSTSCPCMNIFYSPNSSYYIQKDNIPKVDEVILETFEDVSIQDENKLRVINLNLKVTSHRLILTSTQVHSYLINGHSLGDISIGDEGWISKDYYIRLFTEPQKHKLKLFLSLYKPAEIVIRSMKEKKAWTAQPAKKEPVADIYIGKMNSVLEKKDKIISSGLEVDKSFASFDKLFGNLREIKALMGSIKGTNISKEESSQIDGIMKQIGFISVISKEEAGRDYERKLAEDLYSICEQTLFPKYGGMVSLLDLYIIYNKTRQTSLISPGELMKVCQQFSNFNLKARLVTYDKNIKMVESTSFDAEKDFQANYSKYFQSESQGCTAEEVARKKALPLSIVEINLKRAAQAGQLAVADRIEGAKYYPNLFMRL